MTISIVVGYKKEHIMENFPDYTFIYNEDYSETNTSKSLLRALRHAGNDPVLWLNGDVVFEAKLTSLLASKVADGGSFVCVNTSQVGEEEVKYITKDGLIHDISKGVEGAEGEAIGINFINEADKPDFIRRLDECDPNAYFEKALEMTIRQDGTRVEALDISEQWAVEVDSVSDLEQANREL